MKKCSIKFIIPINKIRKEIEVDNVYNFKILEEIYISGKIKKPIFHIDIKELHEEIEKNLEENINNEFNLNNYEKNLLVLRELYFLSERKEFKTDDIKNSINSKNSDLSGSIKFSINDSISSSTTNISSSFNGSLTESTNLSENELYDVILYEEKDVEKKILIPEKNKEYGFVYRNDINTNYITISSFFGEKKIINELSEKDIENRNYFELIGQYFCEKEVEVKLETEKKIKCCPNKFMCKSCMDINKKKYNIKNNYLINIKGRVSIVNKGSYHCFGNFLSGNKVEDCISKFSCKACKLLDLYSEYYK